MVATNTRTGYPREAAHDRNVNLGVINVPVRNKVRDTSVPRSRTGGPPVTQHPSNRRSSVSHARSTANELRDGLDTITKEKQTYELECDYDTNATGLYELLESSNWEKARLRCRTHPEETRTWIVRKDKSNLVRWKLLPLHAAIIFQAPSLVVSTLLERYPAAANRKDDQGMLPLHLAFRHAHEDEALLELLLLENPRAVHQRDRRDRVPLEHGRDSRFSAKLMRLYAEAAVTAHPTNGNKACGDTYHTHATPTTAPSSPSISLTHLHRIEMEHEAKIAKVRADYDYEIEQIKILHADRLEGMKEDMSAAIQAVEKEAEIERRTMEINYQREINDLSDALKHQVAKDQAVTEALEKDIHHLKTSLSEAKHQEEVMSEKYGKLVTINVQMRHFLEEISGEQEEILDMASKQQEYLEAARMIRTELVQTLLKQEDSDGVNERMKGTKMIEIGNRVQRKIHDFIDANGIRSEKTSPTDRRGPSRIEVEREDHIYSNPEGATEVQVAAAYFNNDKEDVVERTKERQREDYDDLEILADEISAITDNSGY